MIEYNIAQIGTFDCENIGDLIFPTVLKAQLDKRIKIKNHFLFSLNNCKRPLDEFFLDVYSIDRLEEIHLNHRIDAIIFGGGDLLRFDNDLAVKENYASTNTSFDLLFYSIFISSKYNIPLLFNCPGVPFEFSDSDKLMLRQYLKQVDYVSTRDNKSRALIESTGFDGEINVFPDSVLSISNLVDVEDALENLKSKYDFLSDKYFVFQSFPLSNDNYLPELITQLKALVKKYDLPVIMFPIGRVHNDHIFLKELIDKLEDSHFIYIKDKLNLTESCALLKGATLFIGTSLHGNIISNSYGTPSIALDAGNLIKVRNSFKILDREEFCIKDISSLEKTVDKVLNTDTLLKLDDAISEVNKHFDILTEKLKKKPQKPDFIEALRCTFYHKKQERNTLTFYFDCGDGFSQNNIKEIFYYTLGHIEETVLLPENCKAVRIDPIEGIFSTVKNIEISSGAQLSFTHNGIDKKVIFFATLDPHFFVATENLKQLKVSFDIEATPLPVVMKTFESAVQSEALKRQLNDTLTHVKNLESIISEQAQTINELQLTVDTLQNSLKEKDTHINNIENSTSWKITAPLRKIKGGK